MSLAAVLAGAGAGASLIVAIGAQNAFILRQALQRQHVGTVVALCAVFDILLIACGVAGTGALVADHPVVLQILRFGGAVFVGMYGLAAAMRALRGSSALTPTRRGATTRRAAVLACLAFTFLNPHTYLDTMVLLGTLSTRYASPWSFGVGAIAASLLWFSLLGYGGRLLIPVFRKRGAWRFLDAVMAAFMLVLAVRLLVQPIG
jgi:L-lysine exporter family protein LysE/ArgO